MQGSGEKLTIAEFAARAGCTKQRIYQLLNNRLKPFTITESGRKYILSSGIETVLQAREAQGYRNSLTEKCETVEQENETVSSPELQDEIDELTAELNETRAALDAVKPQAAALIIDNDRLKQELEKTVNELHRARADLEAVREQRQKAEIKAAAADAERKRADEAREQIAALRADLKAAEENKLLQIEKANEIRANLARAEERERAAQERAAKAEIERDELKAQCQGLTDQLAAIADKQADAIRAGAGERLALAIPEQQEKPGFIARLFHRRKEKG